MNKETSNSSPRHHERRLSKPRVVRRGCGCGFGAAAVVMTRPRGLGAMASE